MGKERKKRKEATNKEKQRSKKKYRTGTTNTAMASPLAGNRKHLPFRNSKPESGN
jgi:hypothetical protein